MVISDCPSISINPGATTLPCASMVCLRDAWFRFPIAEILPFRMPTSPEYQGEPVPSMMCPLMMTTSKDCAATAGACDQSKDTPASKNQGET